MATQTHDTNFRNATDAFGTVWQNGVNMQRDMMNFWFNPTGVENFDAMRTRLQRTADATLELVEKNMDETRRLVETQTRANVEVFKKAVEVMQRDPKADANETTREFFQHAGEATRANFDHATKTTTAMAENFTRFVQNATAAPTNGHDKKPRAAKN